MIVLDTNVISELWKAQKNENVLSWLDSQKIDLLYLSIFTVTEIRFGIMALPAGRRKNTYLHRLNNEVLPLFLGRVLPFFMDESVIYAEIMTKAKNDGKAIGKEDGYIAATAKVKGFAVATRDESPFLAAGVQVLNPWNSQVNTGRNPV